MDNLVLNKNTENYKKLDSSIKMNDLKGIMIIPELFDESIT
jgi:hypothetical protein